MSMVRAASCVLGGFAFAILIGGVIASGFVTIAGVGLASAILAIAGAVGMGFVSAMIGGAGIGLGFTSAITGGAGIGLGLLLR